MAEKKGSTPVLLSEHVGAVPPKAEESPNQAEVHTSDVQKLLVTGTLTTICNNIHIMLGIIICKQWADKYTMETGLKSRFYLDTKLAVNNYHTKVFELLAAFEDGNGEQKEFNKRLRQVVEDPLAKVSENSLMYENAMEDLAKVSENGVKLENPNSMNDRKNEMRVGLMHQLLVKSDVSLETLQHLGDDDLVGRKVGEEDTNVPVTIYSLLKDIMKAEQKAKETRQEKDEIQPYIDAYQLLADEFLNNNLDGFHSLDKDTRECFQNVKMVYSEATRMLKNCQERNATSTQSTQTDGSSYPIDEETLEAILVMLGRGATIGPQILAERIAGVAYAIHIDRLALEKSKIEDHLPFNGQCKKECYANGVSLYNKLIKPCRNLDHYCTEIRNNSGQSSPSRKQKINSSINAINMTITSADRSHCTYELSIEDFKTQMSDGGRYTSERLADMLHTVKIWRVKILHELIVNMKMSLGCRQLLSFVTNASSVATSAELKRQVNSSKHDMEPLMEIENYLKSFSSVLPNLYRNNSDVTEIITKQWARETFTKYMKAFQTGWEGIKEHARDCPKRDEELEELKKELTEVKQERVEMKQKLEAVEQKLAKVMNK